MAIKLKRGLEATIPTLREGEPGFTTDSKKLFIGSNAGNIEVGALTLVEVTWQELKDKRDNSLLTPGQQYRITDYVTTTAQANTQSAGHQFDIIVTADDVDKLNENARAVQHEGDTYFANSKLEAWKLKYCLDNDTARFAWADSANGKGVIYRMIDEFNNDVPYDFKNIQFKRKITDGEFDPGTYDEAIWVYTFTMSDLVESKVVDMSLKQNTEYVDDDGEYKQCANNVIKEAILDYWPNGLSSIQLNDNVFLNIFDGNNEHLYYQCYNNTLSSGCYHNTFGNDCRYNTFGNNCLYNTFSHSCQNNTFSNGCSYNTFSNGCSDNTFGNRCSYNTFSDSCGYNTVGNQCSNNTFGNSCWNNTFGNHCSYNTFSNLCSYNIFDHQCGYNTFSNYCDSNTFGEYCRSNTFGNYCNSNTFGKECRYLKIGDNTSTQKRYISVDSSFIGTSLVNQLDLYDPAILNKDYQVTFKKSASGKYLMLWATDTGTMTGKVKDSNIDNTWEDIV